MANAKLLGIFESVRGAIGDMVVKQYGTKTVITRRPVFRNRTFSEAQKAAQEKFRQAALYAKHLMQDPRARKVYEEEARLKAKPILSLMISDYLNAPSPSEAVVSVGESHS